MSMKHNNLFMKFFSFTSKHYSFMQLPRLIVRFMTKAIAMIVMPWAHLFWIMGRCNKYLVWCLILLLLLLLLVLENKYEICLFFLLVSTKEDWRGIFCVYVCGNLFKWNSSAWQKQSAEFLRECFIGFAFFVAEKLNTGFKLLCGVFNKKSGLFGSQGNKVVFKDINHAISALSAINFFIKICK